MQLSERLGEQGLCVVDVRPLPEYNGWRSSGAARGGHISGAVAFPADWLSRLDDAELRVLLESKGIADSAEAVVYGAPDGVSLFQSRVAEHLPLVVRSYEAGWAEWSADETLPVERLANYEQLIHPAWLRSSSPAAARKRRRPDASCSSTSTSACPRSTPTAIFPERSTSIPTNSRAPRLESPHTGRARRCSALARHHP